MAGHDSHNRIEYVLSRLEGVKAQGDGWVACCPAHEDATPSMTIVEGRDGKIVLNCHAGCDFEAIVNATGLDVEDFFPPREDQPKPPPDRKKAKPHSIEAMMSWSATRALYDYQDETGRSLFVVRRHVDEDGKKTFRQYRSLGNGRYLAGMAGVRRILYRLPELIASVAAGDTVYVVEGEKDVENLRKLGLPATCNVGGAGKWPKDAAGFFTGASVVICPDNDAPGADHAQDVASYLTPVAKSVRVLQLPGLWPKGDVSDWLEAGGTREELERLVAAAAPLQVTEAGPVEYHMTDMGNAQRLVALFGDQFRYCRPAKAWQIWDGRRWARDRIGQIERFAKEAVRQMYAEATEGSTDRRLVEWALKSESNGHLQAMVAQARTEPGVPVLPEQLDADPWALNVWNGVLNLHTGSLAPHDRGQLHSKLVPVAYDPEATCPLWEATLLRLMGGNADLVAYLQRLFGYSLTGSTREDAMFIAYGVGANGKSTVLTVMRELMGDYAKQAQFSTFEVQKNDRVRDDIADLAGARLVCASEGEKGGRLAEAMVKSLTGGDPVKARFLFQELFEFIPEFKLVLASNHKPTIRGTDNGIWRRLRLIPFTVTIPKAEQDKDLPLRMRAEMPGILAWAIRGCLEWQRIGLADPPEVLAATDDYREEMDTLGPFFTDLCRTGSDHWDYSDRLYQAYAKWAKDNLNEVMTMRAFTQRLKARECVPFRVVENNKPRRAWRGIALLEDKPREQLHEMPREQPPTQGNLFDRLPPKPGAASIETETYLV